jgi:hypothetical protein
MKTTIATTLLASAVLAGCASNRIVDDKDIGYMSRQEVSAAISDCESAGQRATVTYAKADWKGKKIPVPVDVQCAPKGPNNYRVGLTRDD